MGIAITIGRKKNGSRRPYSLILGTVLTACVGLGFSIYSWDQGQQIRLLDIQLDELESKQKTESDKRDRLLRGALASALAVPLLKYPINGSSVVGDTVHLAWDNSQLMDKNSSSVGTSIVEVLRVDRPENGVRLVVRGVATDPEGSRSRLSISGNQAMEGYGEYIWRVASSGLSMTHDSDALSWSTYYRFNVYASYVEKIVRTGQLLVGVYHAENLLMGNGSNVEPTGFEKDLVDRLVGLLSERLNTQVTARYVPFSTVEGIIYDGLLLGRIDMAIGNLSRTKSRERHGLVFSRIYRRAPMVLVGHRNHKQLKQGATIGVIEKTLHSLAAERMAKKYTFKPKKNFQDLMYEFTFGDLEFIILDGPMMDGIDQVAKVQDLETEASLQVFYRDEVGYDLGHAIALKDNELRETIDLLLCRIEQESVRKKPYEAVLNFDPFLPPYLNCATWKPPLILVEG